MVASPGCKTPESKSATGNFTTALLVQQNGYYEHDSAMDAEQDMLNSMVTDCLAERRHIVPT